MPYFHLELQRKRVPQGLGYMGENAFLIRRNKRKTYITQGKIQGKIMISVEKVRYPCLLKITQLTGTKKLSAGKNKYLRHRI